MRVNGDKSISHRAFMFAAAARGTSRIVGANDGADVAATREAVAALGAFVSRIGDVYEVAGGTLTDPQTVIDARNSGTTARLLAGLCAGSGLCVTLDGDASLRRRPMERVARPLRAMGATLETTDGRLPLNVRGTSEPRGGTYALELPSAQLKSAILLAGLHARTKIEITGDAHSRDHTERMLRRFGRTVHFDGRTIVLEPGNLVSADVHVPGDLSSAAFFAVAAAITPGSDLIVRDVGVNPTRTGFLDAMHAMGADLELEREREIDSEPIADLHVRYRPLRAADIDAALVVRAIDEIPVLAIAAAHAHGTTTIRGAQDLRSKESDRLSALANMLEAAGVNVVEYPDGLDVTGGTASVPKRTLETFDDHRIAMAAAVLAAPTGPHEIDNGSSIAISFPEFDTFWRRAQGAVLP